MTEQSKTPTEIDIDRISANRIGLFMIRCMDCGATDRIVMSQAKGPGERAGIKGLIFYCDRCIIGNQERQDILNEHVENELEEHKNVDT